MAPGLPEETWGKFYDINPIKAIDLALDINTTRVRKLLHDGTDPQDGKIRGMRSTAELFLYIDVPAAMMDGMVFYRSKNEVILTQGHGAQKVLSWDSWARSLPTDVRINRNQIKAKNFLVLRLDGWLPVKYFIKALSKLNTSTLVHSVRSI